MGINTAFVPYVSGQWVQLCELRPDRISLIVEVQDISIILAPSTAGPQTQSPVGVSPGGIVITPNTGNGRPIFKLTAVHDGDLVTQAFHAWGIPSSALPPVNAGATFTGNGVWVCPGGVNSIDIVCEGAGGCSFASDNVNGGSNSGAGGARAEIAGFVTIPNQTYTVQVYAGGLGTPGANNPSSWISSTGVAPLVIADGCLAQSGQNAVAPPAVGLAAGGLAAASIGTIRKTGGGGSLPGMYMLGMGASAPGGGGAPTSGADGIAGIAGQAGAKPGGLGGAVGGGNGGASDGSASTTGIQGLIGAGCGGSAVTPVGAAGGPVASLSGRVKLSYIATTAHIITVIETFNGPNDVTEIPSDCCDPCGKIVPINPYATKIVQIPPLSRAGKEQFKQFLTKLKGG